MNRSIHPQISRPGRYRPRRPEGLCRLGSLLLALVGLLVTTASPGRADAGPPDSLGLEGRAAAAFGAMGGGTPAGSSRVRLLLDNQDSWYARWDILSRAQESIDVTYYIVDRDIFGLAFLGKLLQKAEEGVRVRLQIDARGTQRLARRIHDQAYLQELRKLPNVEIRVFRPFAKQILALPKGLRQVLASNHDKIMIADGKLAITGGRNLSRFYFAHPEDLEGAYRDCDVLLEGEETAGALRQAFESEWERGGNHVIQDSWWGDRDDEARDLRLAVHVMERWITGRGTSQPESHPHSQRLTELNQEISAYTHLTGFQHFARDPWQGRRAFPTRILDKLTIGDGGNGITENMIDLMDAAERSIVIQNSYMLPTQEVVEAMKRAAARGVEIRFHTNSPASSHSAFTQAFFVRDWWKLLRDIPTLRIFVFTGDVKVHSKLIVVDDTIASVSSYNMDCMSEQINSEIMALVHAPSFARRTRLKIEEDIQNSVEYRISVDANGEVQKLRGPDPELEKKGRYGKLIKVLLHFGFLKPLV